MRHLLLVPVLVVSTLGFSQTPQSNSQTSKALLEEVRLLRQDLRTTTVAAQRVQIALYRLQLQDAAVARAVAVVEETHSRLTQLQDAHRHFVTEIEQLDKIFQAAKENNTGVLYYREAAGGEPAPQSMEVIKLVVKHKLPISMSTKPDFSDVVDAKAVFEKVFAEVRKLAAGKGLVIVKPNLNTGKAPPAHQRRRFYFSSGRNCADK